MDELDREILSFAHEGESPSEADPVEPVDAFTEEDILSFAAGEEGPQRTLPGYGKAAAMSVPRGALGAVGGALRGWDRAVTHPDQIGEGRVARAGQALHDAADAIPVDPMYEGTVPADLGAGVGSMGTFLVGGGLAGVAGRGLGALGRLGQRGRDVSQRTGQMGGALSMAGGAGADEAYERAIQYGLEADEAQSVARNFGIASGAVEVGNINLLLRRLPPAARERLFGQMDGQIVAAMASEFGVAGAGAIGQNWGQMSYDERQSLFDDVLYQAAISAGSAGITQAARGGMARGAGAFEGDRSEFESWLDERVQQDPELRQAADAVSNMDPDAAADLVAELLALPAPTMEVDAAGEAGTTAQREQMARERSELGLSEVDGAIHGRAPITMPPEASVQQPAGLPAPQMQIAPDGTTGTQAQMEQRAAERSTLGMEEVSQAIQGRDGVSGRPADTESAATGVPEAAVLADMDAQQLDTLEPASPQEAQILDAEIGRRYREITEAIEEAQTPEELLRLRARIPRLPAHRQRGQGMAEDLTRRVRERMDETRAPRPDTQADAPDTDAGLDQLQAEGWENIGRDIAQADSMGAARRRMEQLNQQDTDFEYDVVQAGPDADTDWTVVRRALQPAEPAPQDAPQAQMGAPEPRQEQAPQRRGRGLTPMQDPRAQQQGYLDRLPEMAAEAGWAEEGGHLLRDADGRVSGRTTWVPRQEWWMDRPSGVTERVVHEAVNKAQRGELLNAAEKRAVSFLFDVIDQQEAQMDATDLEMFYEAIDADLIETTYADAQGEDLIHGVLSSMAEAEAATEQGLSEYDQQFRQAGAPDAGDARVDAPGETTSRYQSRTGPPDVDQRGARSGLPAGDAGADPARAQRDEGGREGLTLTAQTPQDIELQEARRREQMQREREAEQRAEADRMRDDFRLESDTGAQDGQADLEDVTGRPGGDMFASTARSRGESPPTPAEPQATETPATEAGVSASGALILKRDGTPFQTQRAAELAARSRNDLRERRDQLEAVEVEGGWALRDRRSETAESEPQADSQRTSDPQAAPQVIDSDEADLATRTRAEAAGEGPDRSRLIAVREFLDTWLEDFTAPAAISGRVGDLYRRINTELEQGGDLAQLQRDVAAELRDWRSQADIDADVASEIDRLVDGFARAGFQVEADAGAIESTAAAVDTDEAQAQIEAPYGDMDAQLRAGTISTHDYIRARGLDVDAYTDEWMVRRTSADSPVETDFDQLMDAMISDANRRAAQVEVATKRGAQRKQAQTRRQRWNDTAQTLRTMKQRRVHPLEAPQHVQSDIQKGLWSRFRSRLESTRASQDEIRARQREAEDLAEREFAIQYARDHATQEPAAATTPREDTMYFVNWTNDPSSGRTTETRMFDRLKDARAFAEGKSGYITRVSDGGNRIDPSEGSTRLVEYVGGFQPSATEQQRIEGMTADRSDEPRFSRSESLPDTITVDGVDRPTRNSEGRPIHSSPAAVENFWRWFGDSQVVDGQGRPKAMYHANLADFAEFDRAMVRSRYPYSIGFHFTDAQWEANAYTQEREGPGADGLRTQEGANVMPVYIKAENPLVIQTNQPAASMEADLNRGEIIDQLLQSRRTGNPYDAVIIERRDQSGQAEQDHSNVIAFDSAQIKSAIGNLGTFDPDSDDIRFSRSEAASPRLSAVHNISTDGLLFADRLGGLAVPSIGVVTEDAGGVDGFGEITLIGRRSMADPAREAVFSSDAYSVRHPQPEYRGYSDADYRRLADAIQPFADRYDDKMIRGFLHEHGQDRPDARELLNRAESSDAMQAMFLEEQGHTIEPITKPARLEMDGVDTPEVRAFIEGKSRRELQDQWPELSRVLREATHAKNRRELEQAGLGEDLVAEINRDWDKQNWNPDREQIHLGREHMVMRSIEDLDSDAVDRVETGRLLREAIEGREVEFRRWLEDMLIPAMGEPRIKVGRRKLPYTLENIVEAMTRERQVAGREETMTHGAGQVRASTAERFRTLERMREAAQEQVRSPAEYEAARERTEEQLHQYRNAVADHTTVRDFRGRPDTWEALDASMRAIGRYLNSSNRNRQAFERALRAEEFDVAAIKAQEGDLIAQGMQAADALEQTPVPYFEAKPQREVPLEEFAGAVVPENAPAEVLAVLERRGIPYQRASEENRQEAVTALRNELAETDPDVLFSRRGDTVGVDVGEMTDAEFDQHFGRQDAGAEVPGVGRGGQRRPGADGPERAGTEGARTVGGGTPRSGWVSASVVRDQGAGPRLVHRGARSAIQSEHFSPESLGRATGHPTAGLGVWFTTNRGEASEYGSHVDSVYLDIRTPKVFRPETMPQFDSVEEATAYREHLRAQGYDGIALDQRGIGGPVHFVAFDAEQAIHPDTDPGDGRMSAAEATTEARPRAGLSVSEVQESVDGLMADWQGAPNIEVVDAEWDLPQSLQVKIAQAGATGTVNAVFWRNRVYLVARRMQSREDVQAKLLHEVVGHYGMQQLLGGDMRQTLNRVWSMHGRNHPEVQDIIRRYFTDRRFDVNNRRHRDLVAEELIAHMAERGTQPTIVQRVVAAMRDWMRRMGFDLQMSRADLANLIREAHRVVESGEISTTSPSAFGSEAAASQGGEALSRQDGMGETIDVDGQQRPTTNSEGRPIHSDLDGLRSFWRWFEGSVAQDQEGRPLQLYHGTMTDIAQSDGPVYLTDSAQYANYYAAGEATGSPASFDQDGPYPVGDMTPQEQAGALARNEAAFDEAQGLVTEAEREFMLEQEQSGLVSLMETAEEFGFTLDNMDDARRARINERHPDFENRIRRYRKIREKAIEASEKWFDAHQEYMNLVGRKRIATPNVAPVYASLQNPYYVQDELSIYNLGDDAEAIARLQERGYDGAIWINPGFNNLGEARGRPYGSEVLVFRPDQVKSAVGNVGTFDADSDDVRFSRGERSSPSQPDLDNMPAIENRYAEMARLRGMWDSASDVLRRQPQLSHVADAVDQFFDRTRWRMGRVNAILRPVMREIPTLNRRRRGELFRLFERYQAAKENGRDEEARLIREEGPERVRNLIQAWEQVADLTGQDNQEVGVQVWDDRQVDWEGVRKEIGANGERILRNTPQRKREARYGELYRKMKPQRDLSEMPSSPALPRKGGWRPIGRVPGFFPRVMKREVQQALMHPAGNPETWQRIQDELMNAGMINDPAEAQNYVRNYFSRETSNDYFAGVEKARKDPLPEWFYDYSWDSAMLYKDRWAERVSQIEAFGQADVDQEGDVFDKAKRLTTDQNTQNYLDQVQQRVYNTTDASMITQFIGALNIFATGAMLGNPATAALNLIGGTSLNFQAYGLWPSIRGLAKELADFGGALDMGTQKGILINDYLTFMHDAQQQGVPERLSNFTSLMLKIGGYTPAEVFIRSHAMLTAKTFLEDSLARWNRDVTSKRSLRAVAWFQRQGFDYRRLLEENGEGTETDRFLRKAVNLTQGSYRVNQVPVFTDTPVGRFLFKYQKFGTQLSRMFWINHLKPAIDSVVKGGEVVDVEVGGEVHQKRIRTITPLIRFFAVAGVSGTALAALREGLFGYQDPGPDFEEIERQLAQGEYAEAAVLAAWRFWHSNMSVGSLGFFGNYAQFLHDVADRQRVKSPVDPPGLAPIRDGVDISMRLFEQGSLDWRDLHDFTESQWSLYRTWNRAALMGMSHVSDWRQAQWEVAQRDRRYVRKMVRRYSDDIGLENKRRAPDRIGHTEMTPYNRRIHKALLLGEPERARQVALEALEQAETREEFDRTMMSLQASVRAYQPARVFESPSEKERRDFMRWAEDRVGPESFQRIQRIDSTYREAAMKAGLMSRRSPMDDMRDDLQSMRGDQEMTPGMRRLLLMQRGMWVPEVDGQ
ncbi:hypothetical protein [Thioalkalivibrio sp. ARh3]|uniref:ADP-ribosyltransferase-containing protein n=1 Tax=Thioalkalivibrio sp. ARh3 TaxID=1158148 RepID=UPI0003763E3B|nr:hypothetical protein [Thioalkalivibrio sp. ARh3]